MKKTIVTLLLASLVMTACNFSSSKNKSKEEVPDLYGEYKDRDWYGIGLEQHTAESGKNNYYDTLIELETKQKGKYNYTASSENNNFSLFICGNGDFVNARNINSKYFDLSEYLIYVINGDERKRYELENVSPTGAPDKYNFYHDLVINYNQYNYSSLVFEDTQFASMQSVATSLGIDIKNVTVGTYPSDDPTTCICHHASGKGMSLNDDFLFSTYMNYNPSFKYVGLPSVFSENKVKSWSIVRGSTMERDIHMWTDDSLKIKLDGYTKQQIRTWVASFESAGYETTSTSDQLDSNSPSFTYKAKVKLLKFGVAGDSTDHYLKQSIQISCTPSDTANEFSVVFTINFSSIVVWDGGGTFIFQAEGLIFYYANDGVQYTATIVNKNGTLQTSSVVDGDYTYNFAFPNA